MPCLTFSTIVQSCLNWQVAVDRFRRCFCLGFRRGFSSGLASLSPGKGFFRTPWKLGSHFGIIWSIERNKKREIKCNSYC